MFTTFGKKGIAYMNTVCSKKTSVNHFLFFCYIGQMSAKWSQI